MLGDEEEKLDENADAETQPKDENSCAVGTSDQSSEWDDEEEGGAWITAENLYSNIGGAGGNLLMNNDNELFENQLKVDESKDSVVMPDPGPQTQVSQDTKTEDSN
tara:strand:+ start:590 stop:907 length:318 start_codon:yes stop_codon:yes gene_type:complete